jgi:hypothetical protein
MVGRKCWACWKAELTCVGRGPRAQRVSRFARTKFAVRPMWPRSARSRAVGAGKSKEGCSNGLEGCCSKSRGRPLPRIVDGIDLCALRDDKVDRYAGARIGSIARMFKAANTFDIAFSEGRRVWVLSSSSLLKL